MPCRPRPPTMTYPCAMTLHLLGFVAISKLQIISIYFFIFQKSYVCLFIKNILYMTIKWHFNFIQNWWVHRVEYIVSSQTQRVTRHVNTTKNTYLSHNPFTYQLSIVKWSLKKFHQPSLFIFAFSYVTLININASYYTTYRI